MIAGIGTSSTIHFNCTSPIHLIYIQDHGTTGTAATATIAFCLIRIGAAKGIKGTVAIGQYFFAGTGDHFGFDDTDTTPIAAR